MAFNFNGFGFSFKAKDVNTVSTVDTIQKSVDKMGNTMEKVAKRPTNSLIHGLNLVANAFQNVKIERMTTHLTALTDKAEGLAGNTFKIEGMADMVKGVNNAQTKIVAFTSFSASSISGIMSGLSVKYGIAQEDVADIYTKLSQTVKNPKMLKDMTDFAVQLKETYGLTADDVADSIGNLSSASYKFSEKEIKQLYDKQAAVGKLNNAGQEYVAQFGAQTKFVEDQLVGMWGANNVSKEMVSDLMDQSLKAQSVFQQAGQMSAAESLTAVQGMMNATKDANQFFAQMTNSYNSLTGMKNGDAMMISMFGSVDDYKKIIQKGPEAMIEKLAQIRENLNGDANKTKMYNTVLAEYFGDNAKGVGFTLEKGVKGIADIVVQTNKAMVNSGGMVQKTSDMVQQSTDKMEKHLESARNNMMLAMGSDGADSYRKSLGIREAAVISLTKSIENLKGKTDWASKAERGFLEVFSSFKMGGMGAGLIKLGEIFPPLAKILKPLGTMMDGLGITFSDAFMALAGIVVAGKPVINILGKIGDKLSPFLKNAFAGGFLKGLGKIFFWVSLVYYGIRNIIGSVGDLTKIWNDSSKSLEQKVTASMERVGKVVWDTFNDMFFGIPQMLADAFKSKDVDKSLSGLWDAFGDWRKSVDWDGIGQQVLAAMTGVAVWVSTKLSDFWNFLKPDKALADLAKVDWKTFFTKAFASLGGNNGVFTDIWKMFSPTVDAAIDWFKSIDWKKVGNTLVEMISDGLAGAANAAIGFAGAIATWISGVDWSNVGKLLVDGLFLALKLIVIGAGLLTEIVIKWFEKVNWGAAATAIWNLLIAAVNAGFQTITGMFTEIDKKLSEMFGGWWTAAKVLAGFITLVLTPAIIAYTASVVSAGIASTVAFAEKASGAVVQLAGSIVDNLGGAVLKGMGALNRFSGAIGDAWSAVGKFGGMILDNAKKIIAWGISMATTAWEGITTFVGGVWASVTALWAQTTAFLASPMGWVAIAIAAVIAAVVALGVGAYELIKHWDVVSKFFSDIWDGIKIGLDTLWNWIKVGCGIFYDFYIQPWVDIFNFLFGDKGMFTWTKISTFFNGIWEGIKSIGSVIANAIASPFQTAWDTITGIFSWSNIKGMFVKAFQWVVDVMPEWVKKLLGISTGPSGTTNVNIADTSAMISRMEGGLNSVNPNDNGSVSLGKMQWHGTNAQAMLSQMRQQDPTYFDNKMGKGMLNGDWSKKTFSDQDTANYKSLFDDKGMASKYAGVQEDLQMKFVNQYVEAGKSLGLRDEKAIMFFADLANQYGLGKKGGYDGAIPMIERIASGMNKGIGDLTEGDIFRGIQNRPDYKDGSTTARRNAFDQSLANYTMGTPPPPTINSAVVDNTKTVGSGQVTTTSTSPPPDVSPAIVGVQGNRFYQQEADPQAKLMQQQLLEMLKNLQDGIGLTISVDEKGLLKAIRTDAKNQKQDANTNGVRN